METESYYKSNNENIQVNKTYHFGQLCDGNGDCEELLCSGSIAVWNKDINDESILSFNVIEKTDDILSSLVKIQSIY